VSSAECGWELVSCAIRIPTRRRSNAAADARNSLAKKIGRPTLTSNALAACVVPRQGRAATWLSANGQLEHDPRVEVEPVGDL
jgi:hypothetical protein